MDWITMWSGVLIGSIVMTLLAVLGVSSLYTRRLKRLGDAVEAFARGGCTSPVRIAGADASGDELDRLAAHVEGMSDRIVTQIDSLERGAQQRRELLTNVSHDLRTPLASMQGYLELLLLRHGQLEPAEERNYLETAARQCERLGRLVGDLFHLTELDAGDRQPLSEDFALAELTQDIAQKFAADADRRQVDLKAGVDSSLTRPSSVVVCADIALVERALENLVENALRHTPAGGFVRIEIGSDAGRARLAVRDSGVGIAAEDLPGLFDRYDHIERVAGAAAHAGLGLTIVRRIVRLHGGELEVCSTAGQGTQVKFDLPLATRAERAAA
jgi:signal transduction histidine kinase